MDECSMVYFTTKQTGRDFSFWNAAFTPSIYESFLHPLKQMVNIYFSLVLPSLEAEQSRTTDFVEKVEKVGDDELEQ